MASITQISSCQMPKGPRPISIPCPCDKTPQLTSLAWSSFCKVPEPKSHPGILKGTLFLSVWICFVNLNLLLLYHSDWFGFDGSWYESLTWCSTRIFLYCLCDNLVWDHKLLIWLDLVIGIGTWVFPCFDLSCQCTPPCVNTQMGFHYLVFRIVEAKGWNKWLSNLVLGNR